MLEYLKKLYNIIIKYTRMTILLVIFSITTVSIGWKLLDYNMTKLKNVPASNPPADLQEIFDRVAQATEVTDRIPPLYMWNTFQSIIVPNAFATDQGIYVSFLLNALLTPDEKALVLGHEMSHVIMHHTDNTYQIFVNYYSPENELMADNLGANWADKAGYDVCKGRTVFLKFYKWFGNSLDGDHPINTLRYENLEHYCHKNGAE